MGPQGPRGIRGLRGPKGIAGLPGIPGVDGKNGDDGPKVGRPVWSSVASGLPLELKMRVISVYMLRVGMRITCRSVCALPSVFHACMAGKCPFCSKHALDLRMCTHLHAHTCTLPYIHTQHTKHVDLACNMCACEHMSCLPSMKVLLTAFRCQQLGVRVYTTLVNKEKKKHDIHTYIHTFTHT
jgi:hypothetical protein